MATPSLSRPPISGKDLTAFRRVLLGWYDRHRRDLPWRETRDPYAIWLSEIMLQQTRVAAVLDHYRIFLERFPNVQELAAAPEGAVLAAWSGLGYYRRARMLHRAAKEIVQTNAGRFPQTADALISLPGIGRYTAAAIASIAFGEPVAVVDGNVERVLQRFTGINLTPSKTWQYAQTFLASSRPGDFNQAIMELGATVCLPREPRCAVCLIRKWCVTQGEIPRAASSLRQLKKQIWCVLAMSNGVRNGRRSRNGRGNKIRLVQRPKTDSLMPGMWELPQSVEPPRTSTGAQWRTFRHSITVTNYTVHVLRDAALPSASLQNRRPANHQLWEFPEAAKGKWIAIERIPELPITGLTRKILKAGGVI